MNYDEMLKADLKAECEKRGLDTDGLKAKLIKRLEADDKAKEAKSAEKAKKKTKRFNSMLFRYE